MPASDVPWLGQRIRAERLRQGISVRSLARDVGVSASMISQIETSKSQPSVSTLYAITTTLGVSVEDLFLPPAPQPATAHAEATDALTSTPDAPLPPVAAAPPAEADPGPAPTTVLGALGWMRGSRLGPVVRAGAGRMLTLDSGVTWELLGEVPRRSVDFLRITYPPGGTSSSNGGLMRHPGCEYGYLMHGELVLTLGFDEFVLRPGDTISFDSATPHAYRNVQDEPAIGVWFVLEPDPPPPPPA